MSDAAPVPAKKPNIVARVWWGVKSAFSWLRAKVSNSRLSLFVQRETYDPPPRSILWFIKAIAAIALLWGATLWWAYREGKANNQPFAGFGLFGAEKIETAWKERALSCETALLNNPRREKADPLPTLSTIVVTTTDINPKAKIEKRKAKPKKKDWWEF